MSDYVRYYSSGWKNFPDTSTPITAEALNHMEDGLVNSINKDGGQAIQQNLSIEGTGGQLYLRDTSASGDTTVAYDRSGGARWIVGLFGSSENYVLRRYISGVYQGAAITIQNTTGYATFESQIRSGSGSQYIEVSGPGGTLTYRRPSASGLWDFNMDIDDPNSASIRFHRQTNTTGTVQVQFFKGDGTATATASVDCKNGHFNGAFAKFAGPNSSRLEVQRTDSNNNVNITYAGPTTVRYLGMRNGKLYWSQSGDLALSNAIVYHKENLDFDLQGTDLYITNSA